MKVAISDACGSYFGKPQIGSVRVYEVDLETYTEEVLDEELPPNERADKIREIGEPDGVAFEGEILPV